MMKLPKWAILFQICCAASALFILGCVAPLHSARGKSNSATSRASGGMILDLGAESDFIQVTPEYSNAVLVALLPHFSDFAKKLELPVPHPITQADVASFRVLPFRRNLTASIRLKNGWAFGFQFGYVNSFASAHEVKVGDSNQEFSNYGDVRINPGDAIAAVKETLKQLDISPEDVFANLEAKVSLPIKDGTNAIYPYRVEWMDPFGSDAVDAKVNPNTGKIERLDLRSRNLAHSAPKINVMPPLLSNGHDWFTSHIPPQTINPEYARQLLPIMFKAIDDYAQKLSLPIPRPLTTNNVAKVEIHNNGGWPHCVVETTNGWLFIYRHTMVNGYYSPNAFNTLGYRPLHVKDVEGKWNLTTNQAIEIVRQGLAKLNYPTNNVHMNFEPMIVYASGDFRKIIPRYYFEWYYPSPHEELRSRIEAEVNADNGALESLYYDDMVYWGSRPPIDVPVSIGKP
jgi:hypothetical protein